MVNIEKGATSFDCTTPRGILLTFGKIEEDKIKQEVEIETPSGDVINVYEVQSEDFISNDNEIDYFAVRTRKSTMNGEKLIHSSFFSGHNHVIDALKESFKEIAHIDANDTQIVYILSNELALSTLGHHIIISKSGSMDFRLDEEY